jgi:hypothetical protein
MPKIFSEEWRKSIRARALEEIEIYRKKKILMAFVLVEKYS